VPVDVSIHKVLQLQIVSLSFQKKRFIFMSKLSTCDAYTLRAFPRVLLHSMWFVPNIREGQILDNYKYARTTSQIKASK